MAMRYPGDGETDAIGKLIDTGHPRLAFAAICLRRILIAGSLISVAYMAPDIMKIISNSLL